MSAAGEARGLARYRDGQNALAAGDIQLARQLLAEACRLLPGHGAAHHLLGKAEALLGRPAEAEALQRRSVELDGAIGWNGFALAELLEQRGAWGEAAQAYGQALETLPQEGWIGPKAQGCRQRGLLGGEDLRQGLGPQAYRLWIEQLEPPLPSDLEPLHERWRVLTAAESGSGPLPAQGWLVLLGGGVELRARALQALESALAQALDRCADVPRAPDLLSADEDRLDATGQRCDPWFKPAQLAESSWSTPWLSSFSAWRCSWLREQQLGWPPADPEQRQAWLWRALARQPQHRHVPQVLVHRRATAAAPISRALQARLLQEHLQERGEAVTAVQPHPQRPEGFVISWALPAALRCSVIVPTRDRADLLDTCLSSLTASTRSCAVELEWIVVDNGSQEAATAALLQRWQERLGARLRVLRDGRPFNWSALNNRAAQTSQAELLLFANNDLEARSSGWLEAMAAQAMRPAVGCVGAVLLYPGGRLQHAGVVVGLHGGADHAYRQLPPEHGVHRGRSGYLSDWGAVTGACLMVRRALFERVGGFDPALPVEFNDVDFCLRLGQLGYRHVVDPRADLIHHESQSRDATGSATAQAALERMRGRWGARLASTAPWWPPACSPAHADGRPAELDGVLPAGPEVWQLELQRQVGPVVGHLDRTWRLGPGRYVLQGWCSDGGGGAELRWSSRCGAEGTVPLGPARLRRLDVCTELGWPAHWADLGFLVALELPDGADLQRLELGQSVEEAAVQDLWRGDTNQSLEQLVDACFWSQTPADRLPLLLDGGLGQALRWLVAAIQAHPGPVEDSAEQPAAETTPWAVAARLELSDDPQPARLRFWQLRQQLPKGDGFLPVWVAPTPGALWGYTRGLPPWLRERAAGMGVTLRRAPVPASRPQHPEDGLQEWPPVRPSRRSWLRAITAWLSRELAGEPVEPIA